MYKDRPRLKIPMTRIELVHHVIAFLLFIGCVVYLIMVCPKLPSRFPVHFDGAGHANGWGGKGSLIPLPIMTLVVYGGLTLLGRFPHVFNYLTPITEQNAAKQYRTARMMISWVRILILALLVYVEWAIIQAAVRQGAPTLYLLPILLLALCCVIVYYIVRSLRQ